MQALTLDPGYRDHYASFMRDYIARRTTRTVEHWTPFPHQVPPVGDWYLWLLLAGRGAGKTDACAHYVDQRARSERIRIAIIAPTLADASEACFYGPSGLKAHNPSVRLVQGIGGAHVRWPNGSEARLFGAHTPEDVERLRAGGNRDLCWCEELAAWRKLQECWTHMQMGNRLGDNPNRVVASTTPKTRPFLKKLIGDKLTRVSRATTNDNPKLAAQVRELLYETYGGTTMGRQELQGELIEDVPGALWTRAVLEENRVTVDDLPKDMDGNVKPYKRVAVAIDPAVSSGERADDVGVIGGGIGADGHGYTMADASSQGKHPDGWARDAINLYVQLEADVMVGEVNNGGEMVELTVRTVARDMGVHVNFKMVRASRGKRTRAEPVAALYQQGRIHHLGMFPKLEDQYCEWVSGEDDESPGRLDAAVWLWTELLVAGKRLTVL